MSLFHLSQGAKGGHYKNKIKKLTPKLMFKNCRFGMSLHQCSLNRLIFFITNKDDLNEQTEIIYNSVFHNVTWHFNFTLFHVRLPILML